MRLGHLFTEPEAEYFTSGAWGSSSARRALVSPQAAWDNFTGLEQISSSAFALGTAWDRHLTGEGAYLVRPADIDGRTKAGKEWLAAVPADTQVITAQEGEKMALMEKRMDPHLKRMLEGAQFQRVSRCQYGLIHVQARYDCVTQKAIIDIKKTGKPLEDFGNSAYRYGYHFQAAWYRGVWAAATDETPPPFWFLVTETVSPYRTALFQPDDEFVSRGNEDFNRAMEVLQTRTQLNDWSDMASPIKTLSLPKWAGHQQPIEEGGF